MKKFNCILIPLVVALMTSCTEKGPSLVDNLLKIDLPNGEVIYAHPSDNHESIDWGGHEQEIPNLPGIFTVEEANADFDGITNTTAIIAEVGDNGGVAYAAMLCDDLEAFGFDDWYLPAAGELHQIFLQLGPGGSGQLPTGIYWSSSSTNDIGAWYQSFEDSTQNGFYRNEGLRCRCVRR